MALIDELRKKLQIGQPAQAPVDVQGQLQKLAAAKTGKAAPTIAAPVASSLGQQQAQGEIQAQQQQLQAQVANKNAMLGEAATQQKEELSSLRRGIEGEKALSDKQLAASAAMTREALTGNEARAKVQLSSQEQNKLAQISNAYKNNLNKIASDQKLEMDDIWANFARENKELEFRKDSAQLEQLAHNAAMANEKYLQELNAIWTIQGLENELNFNKESANMAYGNTIMAILDKIGYQKIVDADDRTFREGLGRMDIDQALALGNAAIQQAQSKMIVSGVTSGLQSYVSNYQSDKSVNGTSAPENDKLTGGVVDYNIKTDDIG